MPRGTSKIVELAKEAKARSDAYESGEGFNRALMLKDGQTATGRFCEGGAALWYLYAHPLPKKPGQQYNDLTLCLDQPLSEAEETGYVEGSKPCVGCEIEGVNRTARVIVNFIRYDEPKLVRNAKGEAVKNNGQLQFDGVAPALLVANFATGVGGRIAYLESQFGDITNHVCTIHKTGDKNNPFNVDILDRNKTPEEFERVLYAKKVSPPKAITAISPKFKSLPLMSYGDMKRAYGGVAAAGFDQPPVSPDNVYAQAAQNSAGGHMNLGAFGS